MSLLLLLLLTVLSNKKGGLRCEDIPKKGVLYADTTQ